MHLMEIGFEGVDWIIATYSGLCPYGWLHSFLASHSQLLIAYRLEKKFVFDALPAVYVRVEWQVNCRKDLRGSGRGLI
jgi:hypothetical protein